MSNESVIDRFMTNAAKVSAESVRATDIDSFKAAVENIVRGCSSVYCPEVTDAERLAATVVGAERREPDYTRAALCLDEVYGAVAETGSLICSSGGGGPVQAGLTASHHVAILRSEKVYETLDDFFAHQGDSPPTNITLETGPSRTADIELTLTIGVHGPERLSVIVL
ncbi:MAG: LUD domain-containing protein [Pseudomonadota bacterium]